jgi:GH15 family glucan-1,4-alpha-glucosidase
VSHGDRRRAPAIDDYGLIGDCRTAALVSRGASLDWWCVPRFDSGSCFARLLDAERGGHCSLTPAAGGRPGAQRYVDDTLVLETALCADAGKARVLDCLAVGPGGLDGDPIEPGPLLLRVVEGVRGVVDLALEVAPRFDYADVHPQIRRVAANRYHALGGDDGLAIGGDADLELHGGHDLQARFAVHAGERVRVWLRFCRPEELEGSDLDPGADAVDALLDGTIAAWREWQRGTIALDTPEGPAVRRSAAVLKALAYAPTGAVVAAPTTSLPEAPGGVRNWDYRYAWIRDSSFAVRALVDAGHEPEADHFRRFVQRSAAGHVDDLLIAYGVGGERRTPELELDLAGYGGARPVRIGNAASGQLQLDALGMLVDLTWRWHERGHSPGDDDWRFLVDLVDRAAEAWSEPDRGLWEWRGEPRHFVHSKVLCWAALDRGLRLAEECLRKAPERRWQRARDELREEIEHRGVRDGHYVQAFDNDGADAALLLLPLAGYVAADDPRMVATTDFVRAELADHGLVRRYDEDDGLPGREGAFLPCSFWLVECLVAQGRHEEARAAFDAALAAANHLGLFPEEYDAGRSLALGNFPQALTHFAHVAGALALAGATPAAPAPPPPGATPQPRPTPTRGRSS